MSQREIKLVTNDGLTLSGSEWSASNPKAAVLLVHGLGEHSARYDHVAELFSEAGISFYAYDLRGHGRSDGKRGHAANYDLLMADIFQALEKLRPQHPERPFFLYGHSLGGNLVLNYLLKHKPDIAGAVITSPLLRLTHEPPGWQTAALKLLNLLHLQVGMSSGLDDTALSRDSNVVRTYRNDPLTHDRITPALGTAMIAAGEWILAHAEELCCPLLLMHGDADQITSAIASRAFAEKAGDACALKIWEGSYHELHNEPGKKEVIGHILNWLENCL